MAGFADSIKQHSQSILQQIDKKCYSIAWQLFTDIVYLSPSPNNPGPHAKGLFSNQWYPQVGPSFSSAVGSDTSPYGSASLARINSLASAKVFLGKDGVLTMANNLPYADRVETVGWDRTPPYRTIALSLQRAAERSR